MHLHKILMAFLFGATLLSGCKSTQSVTEVRVPPTADQPDTRPLFPGGGRTSVDDAYVEACTYMMRGDFTSAKEQFLLVIDQKPDHHASLYNLARIDLENREFVSALNRVQSAIQYDQENPWYRKLLVQVYERQGNLKKALAEQQTLHDMVPHDRQEWEHLAELQHRLGQTSQALNTLNAIHDAHGQSPKSLMMKYQWLLESGKYTEATAVTDELLLIDPSNAQWQNMRYNALVKSGDETAARNSLQAWLEQSPGNGQAQILLAEAFERAGNEEKASFWLKQAFSNPDLAPSWKVPYLQTLMETDPGQSDKVMELLGLMLLAHPESPEAASLQARMQVHTQSADSALVLLRRAADADPSSFDTWKQLLDLSYDNGQYDMLYEDSRNAREMFPNNESILFYYGVSAAAQGQYSRASRALQKIMLIEPDDKVFLARTMAEAAHVEQASGNTDEAMRLLDEAGNLAGNDPFVQSRTAMLQALSGTADQSSLKMARQALKGMDNVAAEAVLGLVTWKTGDREGGLQVLTKATRQAEVAEWLIYTGQIHLELGNREEARMAFIRALDAGADINIDQLMQTP